MMFWAIFVYHVDTHSPAGHYDHLYDIERLCMTDMAAIVQPGITYGICRPMKKPAQGDRS